MADVRKNKKKQCVLCDGKAEADAIVRPGEECHQIGPDARDRFDGVGKVVPSFRPVCNSLVGNPDEEEVHNGTTHLNSAASSPQSALSVFTAKRGRYISCPFLILGIIL
jgi:hypothetical protein